jgi:apolipoprotein D and lipocalin family protein
MKTTTRWLTLSGILALLSGCASHSPMPTVDRVELDRFMGTWYVVANIPTWLERHAHNAVEHYALNPDGSIATTFQFRNGAFDGPLKTYRPTGFVVDKKSNALWGMQFLWPIKADYRIVDLTADYSQVIIARQARDYVWVMARQPEFSDQAFAQARARIAELGYDGEALQRVPQQWPEAEPRS